MQILDNLLSNAITYTDKGSVTVSVRPEADQIRLSVRDTGIGIDPESSDNLFDPFHQSDRIRGRRGLGLGLALVKSLVEAHGGVITVQSGGPGTGSEFSFTMPRTHTTPTAAEQVSEMPPRRRVLVVDDQQDVADSLGAMLVALGQDVEVAYSGETALTVARRQRPEIGFLDVSMPEMTGAELARNLRHDFSREELMLVAVTGLGKEHASAADGSFDHHLLKPVSPEAVALLLNGLRAKPRES